MYASLTRYTILNFFFAVPSLPFAIESISPVLSQGFAGARKLLAKAKNTEQHLMQLLHLNLELPSGWSNEFFGNSLASFYQREQVEFNGQTVHLELIVNMSMTVEGQNSRSGHTALYLTQK